MTVSKNNARKSVRPPQVNANSSTELYAENIIAPDALGATIVMTYLRQGDVGVGLAMMEHLKAQHARVAAGDLRDAENMLMSQAVALQGMFADLALRAKAQNGLPQIQTLTALAIKAQSACRATLQALGDLKYPRQATFVKQANIANGPQQVNNGVATRLAHEKDPESAIKLSGGTDELLQDTRTSGAPITGDPSLATVGKVNRAKVQRG